MTNLVTPAAIIDHTARHYLIDAQGYADAARLNAQLSDAERISLAGADARDRLGRGDYCTSADPGRAVGLHERMLQVYIEVQYARPDAGPVPVSGSAGVAF